MDRRLASLDAELDATEEALRTLAAELEAPQQVTQRFHVQIAQENRKSQRERADSLVHRSHPSFSFSHGGRDARKQRESAIVTESRRNGRNSKAPLASSPLEERGSGHRARTGSCSNARSFAKASRWTPSLKGQRFHVWLNRIHPGEDLGFVLESTSLEVAAILRSIKSPSPAATWNAAQGQAAPYLVLQPGDCIVEINGMRVGADVRDINDLWAAVSDTLEVHMIVCRDSGTSQPQRRLRLGERNNAPQMQQITSSRLRTNAHEALNLQDLHEDLHELGKRRQTSAAMCTQAASSTKACTFGTESRFGVPGDKEQGPPILCPSDSFLSNRPTTRSAVISPAMPSKSKTKHVIKGFFAGLEEECAKSACSAGIHPAFAANLPRASADEASTDVGSDRGDCSSLWSSAPSEATEVPGPGAYSPDFSIGRPCSARGTPTFARYSARDRTSARDGARDEDAGDPEPSEASIGLTHIHPLTVKSGNINPIPGSKPRVATSKIADERLSSSRPFYCVNRRLVEPSTPAVVFVAESGKPSETTRLETLRPTKPLGPGCYNLPGLPKGPEAFITPPPVPVEEAAEHHRRPRPEIPGPADYDSAGATGLIYPRSAATDFCHNKGHTMSFQAAPSYVIKYRALEPKWEAVRRRSLSAVVTPLVTHQHPHLRQKQLIVLGPGSYEVRDSVVARLRPDASILRWIQPSFSEDEHTHALYNPRPVDRSIRGDPRALLDSESDIAVRPRHPAIDFRPHSAPPLPPHPQSQGGWWRLYDPPLAAPPTGILSFSRRVGFDDFRSKEAVWKAREELGKRRRKPSHVLAYSLPDLEVIKQRAPQHDFSRELGRPVSDPGNDSPREGDVLALSLDGERELFHPRAQMYVDMAKQLGRDSGSAEPADDFEELVLSPRPVQRRVPVYVNMAKNVGRPAALDFSAHIWADEDGTLYAYQPSAGLRLRETDADELELSPLRGRRFVERRPASVDFSHALGRVGIDPRVPDSDACTDGDEVLLTNWQPQFNPPTRRERPAAPPVVEDSSVVVGGGADVADMTAGSNE